VLFFFDVPSGLQTSKSSVYSPRAMLKSSERAKYCLCNIDCLCTFCTETSVQLFQYVPSPRLYLTHHYDLTALSVLSKQEKSVKHGSFGLLITWAVSWGLELTNYYYQQ